MRYVKAPAPPEAAVTQEIRDTVSEVLSAVEREGDAAVRRYSERFDDWSPPSFRVSADQIEAALRGIPAELGEHIAFAQRQVRGFAELQRATLTDFEHETLPGVILGQRHIPVSAVGSYSPGGRYPMLASAIMTVVTPKVAGVDRVVAAAPPVRGGTGIHLPQLYAMASSGADEILALGGVQAFAALAFGVEDVEPVDMVVGAGNAYVAEAKRQLFGTVGIDLLAGPTEILVIADDAADPDLVAADLLGQAEHGPTSPAVLVTTSEDFAAAVQASVERWLESWPTAEVAGAAWRVHGAVVIADDDDEIVRVADEIATEHLEIQTRDPDWFLDRLKNYGSAFVGAGATVAFSDKAIGTNHVLPTGRAARYTGGLWVGKFLKTVTYQRVTAEGIRAVAPPTAAICDAEGFGGHAITARVRLQGA
ncbi:MAG: sulfopropanediol 3-dehydrogenase [Thermoleophilaceae bacterium]|nr:sulfopropanediol 3-dehydrogenase [Thermoleophilaceae bacterium]